jgi:N-formylmaleamate deformylase
VATEAKGTSRYVTRDGVRLHQLEYGPAGPAIVVVPGITSPAITWEFIAEELARDRRVVLLDVRGRGLSDKPQSGFELPDYAQDVAAVVEQLTLDRPAVLGHSMGARIAAAFGVLHPDLAGPIILVDPPLTGPGRAEYPTPLEAFVEQLEKARAGATAEDMRPYFPTWDEDQLALRAEWLPTCDETAVRETWLNFHREDIFGYLHRLDGPVLFMFGTESPVVTADGVAEVRETNPRLDFVGVAGSGHMIPWDNLDDFLTETRSFLSRVSDRSG